MTVVARHELQVPDDEIFVVDNGGRVLDPWQLVEDDGRLGAGHAVDDRGQGDVSFQAGVDEGHGDGIARLQEGVGELQHGDEVADGEAREQHDGLLHGFRGSLSRSSMYAPVAAGPAAQLPKTPSSCVAVGENNVMDAMI